MRDYKKHLTAGSVSRHCRNGRDTLLDYGEVAVGQSTKYRYTDLIYNAFYFRLCANLLISPEYL